MAPKRAYAANATSRSFNLGKVKMTKETKNTKVPSDYQPRLQKLYKEKVLPALLKEMGQKSPMAVPKLEKSSSTWV